MEFKAIRKVQDIRETTLPVFGKTDDGKIVTFSNSRKWNHDREVFKGSVEDGRMSHDTVLYMTDDEQADTNVTFGFTEQAIRRGDSLVLFDPSGALYKRYTRKKLVDLGYKIRVLDLEHPERTNITFPLGMYLRDSAKKILKPELKFSNKKSETDYSPFTYYFDNIANEYTAYAIMDMLTANFVHLFIKGAEKHNDLDYFASRILETYMYLEVTESSGPLICPSLKRLQEIIQHHIWHPNEHLTQGAAIAERNMTARARRTLQEVKTLAKNEPSQSVKAAAYAANEVKNLIYSEDSIFNKHIFKDWKARPLYTDPFILRRGDKTAIIIKADPEKMVDKRGQIFTPIILSFLSHLVTAAEYTHNHLVFYPQIDDDEHPDKNIYTNGRDYFASFKDNDRWIDERYVPSHMITTPTGPVKLFRRYIPQVTAILADLPYNSNLRNLYSYKGTLFLDKIVAVTEKEHYFSNPWKVTMKSTYNHFQPCTRMSFLICVPKVHEKLGEIYPEYIESQDSISRLVRADISKQLDNNFTAIMISGIREENLVPLKKVMLNTRLWKFQAADLREASKPGRILLFPYLDKKERRDREVVKKRLVSNRYPCHVYDLHPLILNTVPIDQYPTTEEIKASFFDKWTLLW